ncbi:hypothetical protein ZHAS_00008271 [Anopheles sinensis]|uniref:Uncharacterized protein n=1 Tax=Anopheles sinensis TaxID=74873 RepID=A0A084VRR1_ANOSI|nr:hypothetical protein ZHAS_00008271 [Anopheles sinensis]
MTRTSGANGGEWSLNSRLEGQFERRGGIEDPCGRKAALQCTLHSTTLCNSVVFFYFSNRRLEPNVHTVGLCQYSGPKSYDERTIFATSEFASAGVPLARCYIGAMVGTSKLVLVAIAHTMRVGTSDDGDDGLKRWRCCVVVPQLKEGACASTFHCVREPRGSAL